MSTYTWPLDYEKQENDCKSPFFTYGCASQGVKLCFSLGKYQLKVVKLKNCTSNREVPKNL